jgi:hypothetical protein
VEIDRQRNEIRALSMDEISAVAGGLQDGYKYAAVILCIVGAVRT